MENKKSCGEYQSKYRLKKIPVEKYFILNGEEKKYYESFNDRIISYLLKKVKNIIDIKIKDGELLVCSKIENNFEILNAIRDFYEENQIHITRMFGSYILITGNSDNLKAIKATPIPIKYCPLMVKLLKEVGGDLALDLLKTLEIEDENKQTEIMCKLINEVVIKGGYFDTKRPLNSCEANVLFGASETISSAFESGLVDAAVIVSNNLGTIITTNAGNTQGSVKRMTGLFYTSPSKELVKTAIEEGIIPVFPYTAEIDQIEGVITAIRLGYKKIVVSLAAADNYLHKELKRLEEENNIIIYKFGLCSTGISEETAIIMRDNADVIWSCASKWVKKHIEPNALAQVGIKIPVHIMTKRGWEIIKNHLIKMNNTINYDDVLLESENKPIFANSKEGIILLSKKDIHCNDCPHPCI